MAQGRFLKEGGQVEVLFDLLQEVNPEKGKMLQDRINSSGLGSNLPTLIVRLRNALMDSLRLQHGGNDIASRLNLALEAIALLYQKKIWDQALWRLRKAKKLAREYSRLPQLLQLLQWHRKIVLAKFSEDSTLKIKAIRKEEIETMALMSVQNELDHLNFLARNLIRKRFRLKRGREREEFQKLNANPAVEDGLRSEDFLSFIYASNVRGIFLNGIEDFAAAAAIFSKAFDKWRANPGWIHDQPLLFTSIFQNFQISLLHLEKETTRLEECLRFIGDFPLQSPPEKIAFQSIAYQGQIVLFMNHQRFEEGEALVTEMGDWLLKNQQVLPSSSVLNFYYNSTVIFMMVENFPAARKALNQILNFPGKSARKDLREVARLFEIVLLYELGEHDLNEYQIQNTYQFFHRRGISPFEQTTISLLRALTLKGQHNDPSPMFRDYIKEIDNISAQPGPSPFGIMELRIWADARAQGCTLREAFRQLMARHLGK